MPTESTALIRLESCTAVQIFGPGFIDPLLDQLEAEAKSEAAKLDISTEANRKALASLAYKVARSKTFIDDQRKLLVADEKKRLKAIDQEGARIWDRLEALQDEVRKPLTEWEEIDKRRIAEHEEALKEIEGAGEHSSRSWESLTAEAMRDRLKEIETDPRQWEEFGQRAAGVKAVTKAQILQAIEKREKWDAQQAELIRLRQEAAEREQREREERIAREAREKAERESREREESAEREKQAAEQRAAQAEERRIQEAQAAERRAAEAAAQAERDRGRAVEAEKQRRAAEDKRKREEQERRDASARIRKRVLGKISEAIAELGVAPERADVIASALANGKIPNVTVVF